MAYLLAWLCTLVVFAGPSESPSESPPVVAVMTDSPELVANPSDPSGAHRKADAADATDAVVEHLAVAGIHVAVVPWPAGSVELGDQIKAVKRIAAERPMVEAIYWWRSEPNRTRIFMYVPARERVFIRRTATSMTHQGDLEALGLILASSAEALLAGQDADDAGFEVEKEATLIARSDKGAKPPPMPPRHEVEVQPRAPQTQIDVPPEPRRRLGIGSYAGYEGASLGPEAAWQHGLGVGLWVAPHANVAVGIGYGLGLPIAIEGDVALVYRRHDIQAALLGHGSLASWFDLGGLLGLGTQLAVHDAVGDRGIRPLALGRVGLRGSFFVRRGPPDGPGRLALFLEAGAAFIFNNFDYVLACRQGSSTCAAGQTRSAFRPWPVRPTAMAGLAFMLQ